MPSSEPIVVLKFGSSILADEASLPRAVHEIYHHVRRGSRVIAVASAIGKATDTLLDNARRFGRKPDPFATAALAATGEATSVALLGLALDRAGVPTATLDSAGIGLRTEGPALDSRPVDLDTRAIARVLEHHSVLVVPGFVGRDSSGRTTLLGRGGSDLTALYIAAKVGAASCELLKDVDGLYDKDPAIHGPRARRFDAASYEDVLRLDEGIIQHKAVRLARDLNVPFRVGALGRTSATLIHEGPTRLGTRRIPIEPLRVALLGLGNVGLRVYQQIIALPELFEVVSVAVKNPSRHIDHNVSERVLTNDPWAAVDGSADVIVETIGGRGLAGELQIAALARGKSVVTSNKAAVAPRYDALRDAARANSTTISFSAAVGAGAPIIEAVHVARQSGAIASIRAIINGTTNFVLDRLSEGLAFDRAVALAQSAGFAEIDPSTDLNGDDAMAKAIILSHEAFGAAPTPERTKLLGIQRVTTAQAQEARAAGRQIRLVATIELDNFRPSIRIEPTTLDATDALFGVADEHNRAIITLADGTTRVVSGKGAGGYPTAEAVIADLLDLVRARQAARYAEVLAEDAAPSNVGRELASAR